MVSSPLQPWIVTSAVFISGSQSGTGVGERRPPDQIDLILIRADHHGLYATWRFLPTIADVEPDCGPVAGKNEDAITISRQVG